MPLAPRFVTVIWIVVPVAFDPVTNATEAHVANDVPPHAAPFSQSALAGVAQAARTAAATTTPFRLLISLSVSDVSPSPAIRRTQPPRRAFTDRTPR